MVIPEDADKFKLLADVGKFTALALLLCLSAVYLPELSFLTLALCPLPVLVIAARHGMRAGVLLVLCAGVILFPLMGMTGTTPLLLIISSLGLGYLFAVDNGLSAGRTVSAGAALVSIALIVFGLLAWQMGHVNVVAQQIAGLQKDLAAMQKEYIKQGMPREQVEEQFQAVRETLKIFTKVIPASVVIFSIWLSFLSFVLSGQVLKKLKRKAITLPAFKDWQFPWYFAWGYIAGVAGNFFSGYLGAYQSVVQRVGMNFLAVFNILFLAQGFSIVYFYMDKFKFRHVMRALGIGLLIVIPLALPLVTLFGLLDVWFNFRKLPTEA